MEVIGLHIQEEKNQHFSLNQMRTILNCSYKYYLQYIQKREWDYVPSSVMFGKSMHDVLAEYNSSLKNGDKMDKHALIDNFDRIFAFNAEDENVLFKNADETERLYDAGQKLLGLYVDKFSNIVPDEVEMEFRLPVVNTETGEIASRDVVGKIDLIADGVLYEIKTASRSMSSGEIDSHLQLLLYGWAYTQIYGEEPENLGVINLVKTKTPKIQVQKTKLNRHKQKILVSVMFEVLKGIEKGVFYPNPYSKYGCDNCTYSISCEYNFWPLK